MLRLTLVGLLQETLCHCELAAVSAARAKCLSSSRRLKGSSDSQEEEQPEKMFILILAVLFSFDRTVIDFFKG